MTPDLFETPTPADIAEAMESGRRCLRANGYDEPAELAAIGTREGEAREVVRPQIGFNKSHGVYGEGKCNCFVSRYQWTTRKLRADNRVLDYLRGGWIWLGGRNVGTWLLIYCGPQKREVRLNESKTAESK